MLAKNTDVESELLEVERLQYQDPYLDAVVNLKKNSMTQKFVVYVKRQPSVPQLGLLINHFRENRTGSYGIKLLLVADYVSPKLSKFLKENDCDFIDSVGNAYLEFWSVLVYIIGNKRPKVFPGTTLSRAFQPTGLKLIFTLLCNSEDLINRSYRDLSDISGVSLGSVGWIINDLKEAGYLSVGENDKRSWGDKNGLIKRWVIAYSEKLRPKLVLGYYQSLQQNWHESVDIKSFDALWGSEVAADHLTRYLKAEFSTIYTEEQLGKLVLMNGLKEVPDKSSGNVEVLQKFWKFETPENSHLVPPLLIYADLISSGNSRNLETAKLIDRRYLYAAE